MLLKLLTQFLLSGLFGGIGGLIVHFVIEAVFEILGYTNVSANVADVIIIFFIILVFSTLMYLVQVLVQKDLNNLQKYLPSRETIVTILKIGVIGGNITVFVSLTYVHSLINFLTLERVELHDYTIRFFMTIFLVYSAMIVVVKEFRFRQIFFPITIFSIVYYQIHNIEFETIIFEWLTESIKWIIYGTIIGMSSHSIVLIKYLTVEMHEQNNQKNQ